MGRIFLTGDCHKNFGRLRRFCKEKNTTKDDILILLGDSGINYYLDERDNYDKSFLSKLPITMIIVHGNHEERAWNCEGYQKAMLSSDIKGDFYIQEEYPNLLFCHDLDLFYINGKSFAVISGAYSVDKWYRLENGWHWFNSEQISEEDMQSSIDVLEFHIKNKHEKTRYDYVLSHTCPTKYMPTDLFLSGIDQSKVDKRTEEFLEKVESLISYDKWFFGHFHDDRQAWDKGKMLFECFHELEI